MNDIEKFFYDSMIEYFGPEAIKPGFCGMGELEPSHFYISCAPRPHPTREDEDVYCFYYCSGTTHQFTPSFVKECFEASKDGKNALVDYLNDLSPLM
jgi:hypothetical protein